MFHRDRPIAVLWDMDGVITDTGEAHFLSWKEALTLKGIPFPRGFFQETFGMNNRGILSLLLNRDPSQEEMDDIGGLKEELFRKDVRGRLEPLPGVTDWLRRFRRSGCRQAVASSAPMENIDVVIDGLGLREMFDTLVSGSHLSGKPDPATFLLAAERLGVVPEDCLVIEDARVGVEAARRGGMKCVAVCTTHAEEELRDADIVVSRLVDLGLEQLPPLFRP